jgi:hypothetical protein
MKLSEAILLGSTLGRPFNQSSWNYCLCGMGVAALGNKTNYGNDEAEARWPWLNSDIVPPKSCGLGETPLRGRLVVTCIASMVLNERITLDAAVDLIRSIEPEESKAMAEVEVRLGEAIAECEAAVDRVGK